MEISLDSPIYDILERYISLVTLYRNVHYKQRRIRSYGKVEQFSIKTKSYGNFSDSSQIFQQLFVNSFTTSMTLPSRLQISSFSVDVILLQNKTKYYKKQKQ